MSLRFCQILASLVTGAVSPSVDKGQAAPKAHDDPLLRKIFTVTNALLSRFVERLAISGLLFKIFTRILPVATATIRGVRIKVILPLNEYGVFLQFREWERRDPEVLDWLDSLERGTVLFDIG